MTEEYVLNRINELMKRNGWSRYQLSKKSGITDSTLASMFKNNNLPSLPTLFKLCDGFGITVSEFFDIETPLPPALDRDQERILTYWGMLDKNNQKIAFEILKTLYKNQE
ncbi:MAG: helix-turn-helix domain-containing protein [Anaerostipes sp.]|nr:helix-turn-helix transcriptional regulator [Anaerostipes sp.]